MNSAYIAWITSIETWWTRKKNNQSMITCSHSFWKPHFDLCIKRSQSQCLCDGNHCSLFDIQILFFIYAVALCVGFGRWQYEYNGYKSIQNCICGSASLEVFVLYNKWQLHVSTNFKVTRPLYLHTHTHTLRTIR